MCVRQVTIDDVETVDAAYFESPAWLERGIDRTAIVRLTLCDMVKTISESAFSYCEGLKSLVLGSSVVSIGEAAFRECIGLASLVIPDSVKTIDHFAFHGCEALTLLTLGASVVSIGNEAFSSCWPLRCIGIASLEIPNSVKTIGDEAFRGCEALTKLTLGASVESIGREAFRGCIGLASLKIPDSVKTIGHSAFYECEALTSLTLGASVESIGRGAFQGCIGLTSLIIPNSVKEIKSPAFAFTSLTSVVVPVGCEVTVASWHPRSGSFPPGCQVTVAPAATSVAAPAVEEDDEEDGEEEEDPQRQFYSDLLDKATAMKQDVYTWTIRTPDGDDILPMEYRDLIDQKMEDWFIDKCFHAVDFVNVPQPSDATGITKLKVEIVGSGGRLKFWGLKNDTVVALESKFAREHFKAWFIQQCANAENQGKFVHVPIGDAEDRPIPSGASLGAAWELGFPSEGGFDSCGKPVTYRDVGKKGLCAPYGLASVLDGIGARDNSGGDLGKYISKDAKTIAQARGKGSGGNDSDAVKACVDVMNTMGWPAEKAGLQLSGRNYSVTQDVSVNPTLVQLTEGHCVTTIKDENGEWVVDSNEENWLPLSHKTLSRCMGVGRQYKSGGAIRAYRFAPGKKARKFTKRARGDADQQVSKKQKS